MGCCCATSNPISTNSKAKQASYADSNRPGPRAVCTFIAAPRILSVIVLSPAEPLSANSALSAVIKFASRDTFSTSRTMTQESKSHLTVLISAPRGWSRRAFFDLPSGCDDTNSLTSHGTRLRPLYLQVRDSPPRKESATRDETMKHACGPISW